MADPKNEMKDEVKALEQKSEETFKACDLDVSVMKKSQEEAMKKLAPAKK